MDSYKSLMRMRRKLKKYPLKSVNKSKQRMSVERVSYQFCRIPSSLLLLSILLHKLDLFLFYPIVKLAQQCLRLRSNSSFCATSGRIINHSEIPIENIELLFHFFFQKISIFPKTCIHFFI